MGATKGTKFDAEMSLHEEDCHRFLTALQAHFGISSELIHTLIHSLSQEIPDTVATAAATEARKMVFDNLVRYFDRTFALYDPKSSIGNRRRDVKSVPFLFELENYLLTVLTDFMEIYCDWLLSSGSQYPPVVQSYIEDGGIPKIVWESWNEIIAYLMRMLQWRDIEEKRQVAEKK
jgi:hypothetical protein